jgi:carboxyl-terminal processing protease
LSDKDFADFKTFVKSNNFDYQSATEKTLEEIKKTTTEENYFDAIQPAYTEAIASLKAAKEKELDTHSTSIKPLLENEICNRYFYTHGKIEKSLQSDPWVKKAIELLDNNKMYKDLLSSKK